VRTDSADAHAFDLAGSSTNWTKSCNDPRGASCRVLECELGSACDLLLRDLAAGRIRGAHRASHAADAISPRKLARRYEPRGRGTAGRTDINPFNPIAAGLVLAQDCALARVRLDAHPAPQTATAIQRAISDSDEDRTIEAEGVRPVRSTSDPLADIQNTIRSMPWCRGDLLFAAGSRCDAERTAASRLRSLSHSARLGLRQL